MTAELEVGSQAPELEVGPLTVTDFVRYQGASGDMNPIHHDSDFARRAGFPAPFAVGMLAAGFMSTQVTDWLGADHLRLLRFRFREQAWPGDVLTCRATITALREEAGERFADLEISCMRQTGGAHITGVASFVIGG